MSFMSVKAAAKKFNISERRVQKLCEDNRIKGAKMLSNVWLIPTNATKPSDARITPVAPHENLFTLKEFCEHLSISIATGKNWLKLEKITPTEIIDNTPFFSSNYTNTLKDEFLSGTNTSLKSRRNKKYISGNGIYKSYISSSSVNNELAQQLIYTASPVELCDETINYIIAEAGIRMLCQSKINRTFIEPTSFLLGFLNKEIDVNFYKPLIDDLILSTENAKSFIHTHPSLFNIPFIFEPSEDILGLLYISLKNIGDRKATGSYYTPTHIVQKLIDNLKSTTGSLYNQRILDPCCGTGNFLLQLPGEVDINHIYGNDIDINSVKITRLNLAMRHNIDSVDIIYNHITVSDFLLTEITTNYDLIIGNPPWGYSFSDVETESIRLAYKCPSGKNIESYDVFIEQSLKQLNDSGFISFVLPEAILNVKSHTPIREIISRNCNITTLEYLGNAFDQVQCPCIILELNKNCSHHSTQGMKVYSPNRSFVISTERIVSAEHFNFNTTDMEYRLINKLTNPANKAFLLNNAEFALGIVTGNNKDYVTSEKKADNEPILKGIDIYKYKISTTNNYICFTPDKFQQVAPTKYYRAPEKLLYRFICNQLVFAYDNQQTLSLNSCNIVIPHIDDLQIKYILAILNSRIAQFIFEKSFSSIKVLRSHIEHIPIPIINKNEQTAIIELVDKLLLSSEDDQTMQLYNQIDNLVSNAFSLSSDEYKLILTQTQNKNLLLY